MRAANFFSISTVLFSPLLTKLIIIVTYIIIMMMMMVIIIIIIIIIIVIIIIIIIITMVARAVHAAVKILVSQRKWYVSCVPK